VVEGGAGEKTRSLETVREERGVDMIAAARAVEATVGLAYAEVGEGVAGKGVWGEAREIDGALGAAGGRVYDDAGE
jgi:hypothetical protein